MRINLRNLIIGIRQEIIQTLLDSGKSTRGFCLALTLFYFISVIVGEPIDQYVGITPGKLIGPNFNVWTLITHCFIENSLIMTIMGYTVILGASRLLEPVWGQMEFSIFFATVNVMAGLLTAISFFLLYVSTFNTDYLFNTHIHGLAGLKGGVVVALKQTRGEDTILPLIKLKQVPLIYTTVAALLVAIGVVSLPYFILLSCGLISAWVYLRFYQRHSRGRGDLADHFSFASFFPKIFRGPIGFLSDTVYNLLVRLRICSKATYNYDVAAPTNITISLPGTSDADAERRRKKALAVLSKRLQSVETQEDAWSDDDNDTKQTTKGSDAPDSVEIEVESAPNQLNEPEGAV
jgi:membrane associated rhomboid family serine protease